MQANLNPKLGTLKQFFHRYRRLPSFSELLKIWKLSSKNAVFKNVQKLIEAGFLQKDRLGKIAPTTSFFAFNVYGQVPAGFPVPTPDEQADLMSLNDYLIDNPNQTFLLKVGGDSLKEAGIMPQDLVIIERQSEARNGQIVLAHIDHEWTLKIFEKVRGQVRLLSANKEYAAIIPKTELLIYGVVKGVIRKYQ